MQTAVRGASGRARRVWAGAVALVMAAAVLVVPNAVVGSSGASAAPSCTVAPPPGLDAARPDQLRERYDLDDLFAEGHDGQGQVGVILEFGQSVDLAGLANWEACLGAGSPPITQTLVGGGTMPAPNGEAQADAQSMITGAPGLDRLYSLVTNQGEIEALPELLRGVLDGSLTDGRRADVVSLSFGTCEQQLVQNGDLATITDHIEPLFEALARSGTWFFKAAGDAGSSDCSPHGSDPNCVPTSAFDTQLAAGYPASSPWVTSVGGTMLPDGVEGPAEVWNSTKNDPDDCSGGGGAVSALFATPSYQATVPDGPAPPMRGVPDVAALGGSPGYLSYSTASGWYGNQGTSYAAPLYAGATASVRSALVAAGVAPPTSFNDALYDLANDPATFTSVFDDITVGDNSIYDVNPCCAATRGYDLASGLGELRVAGLAAALLLQVTTPTTAVTTTTTAPAPVVPPRFTG